MTQFPSFWKGSIDREGWDRKPERDRYDENGKRASDPEILTLIRSSASEFGIQQREISDEEILERCIYALINEGARILEDGYAVRAVDIIYLNGYGFPAYRGGPMFYADTVGLASVYEGTPQEREIYVR